MGKTMQKTKPVRGIRSVLYAISFLIIAPLLFLLFLFYQPTLRSDAVAFLTKSGPVKVNVEVADNPLKWQTGLMNRTHLAENAGMLFIFSDESERHFWMKNTLLPLDMIFISANKEVVSIARNAEPCTTFFCPTYPGGPAMYVVEVNGGFAERHGIDVGDKVEIGY